MTFLKTISLNFFSNNYFNLKTLNLTKLKRLKVPAIEPWRSVIERTVEDLDAVNIMAYDYYWPVIIILITATIIITIYIMEYDFFFGQLSSQSFPFIWSESVIFYSTIQNWPKNNERHNLKIKAMCYIQPKKLTLIVCT